MNLGGQKFHTRCVIVFLAGAPSFLRYPGKIGGEGQNLPLPPPVRVIIDDACILQAPHHGLMVGGDRLFKVNSMQIDDIEGHIPIVVSVELP